jgi:hypothetical protein
MIVTILRLSVLWTLLVDLYCFGPDTNHVHSLACAIPDVFWSAIVDERCACDDCLFFSA